MLKIPNLKIINKYPYLSMAALVAIAIISLVIFGTQDKKAADVASEASLRTVDTLIVSDHATAFGGVFAPTAAGNSFVVRSESGGRVNQVAAVGREVKPGDVLAELDNRSQLAALTQAQGVYEAALANAGQSRFSVDSQSESLDAIYSSANSSLRSVLIDVKSVMQNTVESFFNTPTVDQLNLRDQLWTKKQINYAVADWEKSLTDTLDKDNLMSQIDVANDITYRLFVLISAVHKEVAAEENGASDEYAVTLATYRSQLLTAQNTISKDLELLRSTKLNIQNNEAALERAQSSSIGGSSSAVEAQVKQALGSLRAAEANYAKTIVRAPFAGTVTSLNVSVGDIINLGTDIAILTIEDGATVDHYFDLPIKAIKYTPTGAYILALEDDGKLTSLPVETGLVTTDKIRVTGLTGGEVIVSDVRGLKAGEQVIPN